MACNTPLPILAYVSPQTATQTKVCYQDRQYYQVIPPNKPNKKCYQGCYKDNYLLKIYNPNIFIASIGIATLNIKDNKFSSITKEDLIISSIHTYKTNSNNTGKPGDFINNKAKDIFMNHDITMPNFIRLPVCDGETAHKTWDAENPMGNKWPCPDKS